MRPELSVVIPVLTGSHTLNGLLRSLKAQQKAPEFEILVVFNPRPGKVRNPGFAAAQLRILHSLTASVNRARALAVNASVGQWLYFLDADCVLNNPFHLRDLARELATCDENVVCGGPYLLASRGGRISRAYQYIQDRWLSEGFHPNYGWTHLLGGNMAVARSVFDSVRFDETIVFGGAETDFLAQWLRAGGQGRLLPTLAVQHVHDLQRRQFVYKAFMQGYGFERLIRRGLLNKGPRRSLKGSQQRHEVADLVRLYDEVFSFGRDFHVLSPRRGPTRAQIRRFLFMQRLKARWYEATSFGEEVKRWMQSQCGR